MPASADSDEPPALARRSLTGAIRRAAGGSEPPHVRSSVGTPFSYAGAIA